MSEEVVAGEEEEEEEGQSGRRERKRFHGQLRAPPVRSPTGHSDALVQAGRVGRQPIPGRLAGQCQWATVEKVPNVYHGRRLGT